MIVIEYMENGALDAFLRVSNKMKAYINIYLKGRILYTDTFKNMSYTCGHIYVYMHL